MVVSDPDTDDNEESAGEKEADAVGYAVGGGKHYDILSPSQGVRGSGGLETVRGRWVLRGEGRWFMKTTKLKRIGTGRFVEGSYIYACSGRPY